MNILDMPSTEVGVPLVSKVLESVDNIELNCWRKRKEKEHISPIVAFNCGFMTQESLSRQQAWSNGSDVL